MKKRLILLFFTFVLHASLFAQQQIENRSDSEQDPCLQCDERDQSVVLDGEVFLENREEVIEVLFKLSRNISDEYFVSDGMSMTMYLLRYMADIGEYELVNRDISKLIESIEDLIDEKFDPFVWDMIKQIRKIRFGKMQGKLAVEIYPFNEKEGVVLALNKPGEGEDSALKEIKHIRIKNKARIYFTPITKQVHYEELEDLVKKKFKILGFIGAKKDSLNLIHSDLVKNYDQHFEKDKEDIVTPLLFDFDGIEVVVETNTFLKQMSFDFKQCAALPGMRTEQGDPVPSFIMTGKTGPLRMKTTIDE